MSFPRHVSILGLGLMGGSIGLALRARFPEVRRTGWSRRASTREQALASGVVHEAFATPADAVRSADLVVLCGPIMSIPAVLRECADALAPGAVVTDVGSTKEWLATEVPPVLAGTQAVFVGSHPMCGSEQQGLSASRAFHQVTIFGTAYYICKTTFARKKIGISHPDQRLVHISPCPSISSRRYIKLIGRFPVMYIRG